MRRKAAVALLLVGLGASLAACGSDDDDGAGATATTAGSTAAAVTITHALGSTKISGAPVRVVTLGPADQDAALALGVTPVGTVAAGIGPDDVAPWSAPSIGTPAPTVLAVSGDASQVNLEEVAALHPDLILAATYYDIDAAYDELSAIAPTTAYQVAPVTDTWQQVTRQVGQALARTADAEAIIADVEQQVIASAGAHPSFAGRTFTFGFGTPASVSAFRDPDDVMMTVPAGLGLTLSPAILGLPDAGSFAVDVSLEQLDLLDADVLAMYFGDAADVQDAYEANPLFAKLPAVQRGAYLALDTAEFMALRNPTALSIPWTLTGLGTRLAGALDG